MLMPMANLCTCQMGHGTNIVRSWTQHRSTADLDQCLISIRNWKRGIPTIACLVFNDFQMQGQKVKILYTTKEVHFVDNQIWRWLLIHFYESSCQGLCQLSFAHLRRNGCDFVRPFSAKARRSNSSTYQNSLTSVCNSTSCGVNTTYGNFPHPGQVYLEPPKMVMPRQMLQLLYTW